MLSYSCPHCDQLDQEIKANGYSVWKLPKNQPTDVYKKDTCKDKKIPVIMCGHRECQASSWLESSPVPENWNILQLHVADDSDEIPVQSNQRVKVISYGGPDDGVPMNEVLDWLNSVSRRGSITSIDSLKLDKISKGVEIICERTSEILDKQDQTNTSISAMRK